MADRPVYSVSGRSLNSSRKAEFGDSGHCRTSTSEVSKIAVERPLSKMRQCANDPFLPVVRSRRRRSQTSLNGHRRTFDAFWVALTCRDFATTRRSSQESPSYPDFL